MRPHIGSFRLQRMTAFVMVGAVAVSCLAFFLARGSVEHNDQLLLSQDASQGSLVLSPYLAEVQPQVAGLEAAFGPDGVNVEAWQAAAKQAAGVFASAMALVRVSGEHLQVVATIGTLHTRFGTAQDSTLAAAIEDHRLPYDTSVTWGATHRMIELTALPSLPAGYGLYTELTIPMTISLASLPGHPFANIQAALYAGYEKPQDLVFATTSQLPLTGERAIALVPNNGAETSSSARLSTRVGSVSSPGNLLLVMTATASLTGTASARMPWILLAVLLLTSLVGIVLFEISGRRRIQALTTAQQLEERNTMLDRAVDQRRRTDARFAALVRSSSDLITVISADGTIVYQSPSSKRLLGAAPESLVGTNFSDLVHDEDVVRWHRAVAYTSHDQQAERVTEWRLKATNGDLVPVETRTTNLLDDPAVAGIVLNSRDVSERNRLEEELRHQAFHDSLTGLANRALFLDRLEHAVSRLARSPGTLGVLFLDLDDFKAVNDGRGHGVGDDVLKATGERLLDTVRAGDTLARLGGDEFAVLLENTDPATAAAAADRILDALQLPLAVVAGGSGIRASIGVVTTSDSSVTPQELLREADIAMYSAKSAGKGRSVVFNPGLHHEVINRLQLEADLARAIEEDQLAIEYQPIVDLTTGEVTGVEALMRWHHPHRGVVMPGEFIPVAESTGLIVPMGRWLLGRACRDVRRLQEQTERFDLQLAVNLSTRQIDDPALVHDVSSALAQSGLFPAKLTLEITESVFMGHPDRSVFVLEHLKDLGVMLSIDDFGTGYSSLAYLQRLPVDELKIDRAFVADDGDATDPSTLIETIVHMAKGFGLGTVAEGIETETQLLRLRDAGCHLAQGFFFARPADIAQVRQLVAGSSTWRRLREPTSEHPTVGGGEPARDRPLIAPRGLRSSSRRGGDPEPGTKRLRGVRRA